MEDFNISQPEVKAELTVVKKNNRNLVKPIEGPGLVWLLIVAMLVMAAVSVGIFGNNTNDGSAVISKTPLPADDQAQHRIYTVSYRGGVFSPTNLRIKSGDSVRFKNDGLFPIKVVSDSDVNNKDFGGFDSVGDIPPGSYFSVTFAVKGIFGYHNEKNANEVGTIIVR